MATASAPVRLLLNADVFSPAPVGVCHLLVGGGRILWMGAEAPDLALSSLDATVTDMEGRRVVPGLVDGHVHVTGGGGEAGFGSRVAPMSADALVAAATTTVIGVLGTDDVTRGTAEVVANTRRLRAEGISAYCMTGGYHLPPTTLTGSVADDIVHVDPIIGVGELALSDHRSSQPTLHEVLRVVSDAYVAGMLAGKAGYTHLHIGDGGRGLALIDEALATELPARVFHPTHVNRRPELWDEALKLAGRGCFVDVTAFPPDPDEVDAVDAVIQFAESGLPANRLTVSSDAGGSLPCFEGGHLVSYEVGRPALADTLARVVDRGVPLGDALMPFTTNPAQVAGLTKGCIEVGFDADLVVLDDDHRPTDVMALGDWRMRDGVVKRGGHHE